MRQEERLGEVDKHRGAKTIGYLCTNDGEGRLKEPVQLEKYKVKGTGVTSR